MEGTILTQEGLEKLKAELKELKSKARPQVIKEIRVARAHGDLSENAEYHAAKEKQVEIEGRIGKIEEKLSTARIIDTKNVKTDEIVFGATVTVVDLDDNSKETFFLTSPDEADPLAGKISTMSPIGKGLLNKKVKDKVTIQTPGGQVKYQIKKIQYN